MMLIVNMVQGSFMATIAEGLTLAQVTGQSQQTLLDILNQGQLASIFLDQKCQSKSPVALSHFPLCESWGAGSGHCPAPF
jgi:3-hydroxyisobutyrate dehydrogenase-like beta-hydroxyacid dehydrogenase